MNNLEVFTLTKKLLKEAVLENKYWNGIIEAPFSKNKAKWILENNRAEDDDALAILGYENNNVVALVYLVPDLVIGEDGIAKKIFWSQRWWVSDKYKDTVLSAYVKNMSLNECGNQVVVKFVGDNTKAYYDKQPFSKFSKRKRYIIIFSLDYGLLIHKKNSLKKIAPVLKTADSLSRKVIAVINRNKTINKNVTYKNVQYIEDEVWSFLEKHCISDIVPKSKDYVNWQISNSQYQILKNSDKSNYNCLLGSISENINNINIVVKLNNETVGFVSAFNSKNRFVIRYFIANEANYNDCLSIMFRAFKRSKCTILQTENEKLGKLISSKYFKVYCDVKELVSLVHNDVNVDFNNSLITDQDGNMF